MPEEKRFRARYARQVGTILDCLIADRIPIIAVTLLIGLIGAVAGKLTDTTSSSAQLLMTPLPLESIGEDEIENLARMAFEPMDVKTASSSV